MFESLPCQVDAESLRERGERRERERERTNVHDRAFQPSRTMNLDACYKVT